MNNNDYDGNDNEGAFAHKIMNSMAYWGENEEEVLTLLNQYIKNGFNINREIYYSLDPSNEEFPPTNMTILNVAEARNDEYNKVINRIKTHKTYLRRRNALKAWMREQEHIKKEEGEYNGGSIRKQKYIQRRKTQKKHKTQKTKKAKKAKKLN